MGIIVSEDNFVPTLWFVDNETRATGLRYGPTRLNTPAGQAIYSFFRANLDSNFKRSTIFRILRRIRYRDPNQFLDNLRRAGPNFASWNKLVERLSSPSRVHEFERIRLLYLLAQLDEIPRAFLSIFGALLRNVAYIEPVRATGQRYYRMQELAVEKVDARGENLAMFLHSLNYSEKREFSAWLSKFLGFRVETVSSHGHVQLLLGEFDTEEKFTLADMGYGFSQVLPVMAQIWSEATGLRRRSIRSQASIVAIEQPELHLHPAYQTLLADAFVGCIELSRSSETDKSLSLIVETHSQQIINRLGELIGDGKLSPKDVAIYLFEKSVESGVTKISRAKFDKNGELEGWPYGFFSSRR